MLLTRIATLWWPKSRCHQVRSRSACAFCLWRGHEVGSWYYRWACWWLSSV